MARPRHPAAPDETITNYVMKNGYRENAALDEIAEFTKNECAYPNMMLDQLEGQLLSFIVKAVNAKKCIEVGYNSVNMALSIPDDGKVVALDVNEKYVNMGRPIWKKYGVDKKIEVILGDAKKSLQGLIDKGEEGTYDFVLIDADKESYDAYYEFALKLLKVNGIIAVDNVIWQGKVTKDESEQDKDTKVIHNLNKKIVKDERVDMSMNIIGDGITLCRKL